MNGVIGLGAVIALLFCISDPNVVLSTSFTYPFIEIFKQATKSVGGSAVMVGLVLLVGLSVDIGIMAAASRMLWSFARDRGFPRRYISKVDGKTEIPVIAIFTTTVLSVILSFISIGSLVAFNDVVSLTLASLYVSYFVVCALLLWRKITGSIKTPDQVSSSLDQRHRANSNLPGCAGNLIWGRWRVPGLVGTAINAFGCIYLLIVGIFAFFPPTKEVHAQTMKYSSLVMGSVAIFGALYYIFWARGTYDGPIIETRS